MPLGSARLTLFAKPTVAVEAEVIRKKVGVSALGNAQIDTAQSKFGGASYLGDGTGDGLSTTGIYEIGTGDFTIECWARLDNVGVNQMFFDCRPTSTNGAYPGFFFLGSTNKPYYYFNTATRITADSTLSTNTWYHLAVVRSSGVTTMYIDGTAQSTTYTNSDSISFTDAHIGISNDPTPGQSVDGFLDEVRISDSARYTTTFTPSTTPFVNDDNTLLLLHMNGTDASTFFEDDNGVGRSSVGMSAEGSTAIDTAQYKFNDASILSTGSSDAVLFSQSVIPTASDAEFTIECWIRITGTSSRRFIYSQYTSGTGRTTMEILDSPSNKIAFFCARQGSFQEADRIISDSAISVDTWYHVAVVRESTTFTMYIDGVAQTDTITGHTQGVQNQNFELFRGSRLSGFGSHSDDVWIDELRISDTARYTSGFTPSTTPFVNDSNTLLLLHMDGTDASTDFLDDNGTGRSAVGVSASGNAQIDTADSKFGGSSALFDGTGDFLTLPNQTFTGDFTIEFFAKPDAATSLQVALRMGHWTGSTWQNDAVFQFRGSTAPSNTSRWYVIFNDGTLGLSVASGGGGVWSHIAVCRSGGTTRLFKDGALVDSVTVGSPSQIGGNASTDNITIGAVESGGLTQDFDGWIDEVRISDTARYTAAFTAPTEPFQNDADTTLLLHMDGTDGSTVFIDDNGKQA